VNFFAIIDAFSNKYSLLISIGMYSLGSLNDFINLLIFLFEPLPNSTIVELIGNFFLISFCKLPSISNSLFVG